MESEANLRRVRFLRERDAEPAVLSGLTIAVIGYGNLGRAMALNLRDSGVTVLVGNRSDEYRLQAESDGLEVYDIADAVAAAQLVYLLVPDEAIAGCYLESVAPVIRAGAAVCFGSGYPIAYHLVESRPDIDVLMLAPRMLGTEVRRTYQEGIGFFSYLWVEQDASGDAWRRLLALAHAAGSLQRGALALPATDEATLDLFVEQSVGPYLGVAIQLAFQLGVEAGLPAEALVLELYMSGEMSRTIQGFAELGFFQAVHEHGVTATYGGFLGALELDREGIERRFREVLHEISSGAFAIKLQNEQANGYPTLAVIREITQLANPLTAAEDRVRAALIDKPAGQG